MGYFAASSGNSLQTFRDNPSVPSSRAKNPKGPMGCLETSVRIATICNSADLFAAEKYGDSGSNVTNKNSGRKPSSEM